MQNLIIAFLLVSFYCYGDSVTATGTCQSIDGITVSGVATGITGLTANGVDSCSIGPYYDNAGDYIQVSGGYSAFTTLSTYDFYAVASEGANASYGAASEAVTALFDISSVGPERLGFAQLTGEGWGINTGGWNYGASHPQVLLNGQGVGLNNADDGLVRDASYIVPIELGTTITIALSAYSSLPMNDVVGGFAGGGADLDIQLFEDVSGVVGAPVPFAPAVQSGPADFEVIAQTPEPSTWPVLVPLLFALKVFEGGWLRGRIRSRLCRPRRGGRAC